MRVVIGLVGEKGAGKTEIYKILQDQLGLFYEIERHATSDVLRETLNLWGIPITRENLQNLAIKMRETYGPDVLANVAASRALEDYADIVVIDGLRWPDVDIPMIRRFHTSVILYVTAESHLRWERTVKRKENSGEEDTSYEKFMEEELAGTEVEITEIGESADYKIENNNNDINELSGNVLVFINSMIIPILEGKRDSEPL